MEQRFTFDQVADLYTQSRPHYPAALVDDVVALAAVTPGDPVLEVGCGTGQATRSFAARGLRITAIDPGPDMIRAARQTLAGLHNVELRESTFEAWPEDGARMRLIIAAQSWHWVAPEVRFAKAARMLSPAGSLAVFGHVPVGLPAPLLESFRAIWPPPEAWYLPSGPFKGWFDSSGLFGPVVHRCYAWTRSYTAASYVDVLTTRSDIRMLPAAVRDALLADITAAIVDFGGEFVMDHEAHLYLARRVDGDAGEDR
ncbi:class I SAM-dependent methyltransferase [Bradyrhizobium oligotrophicum]|uniref:class I SAM-dependent methyltransferase n=1 Tax=Bradyrhizobium oligotrophicum TaxID=44255 RepID=UPI003EB92E5B